MFDLFIQMKHVETVIYGSPQYEKVMHYWWSRAFLSIFISCISFLPISRTSFHCKDESPFDSTDVCVPLLSKKKLLASYILLSYILFLLQQQPSGVSIL